MKRREAVLASLANWSTNLTQLASTIVNYKLALPCEVL